MSTATAGRPVRAPRRPALDRAVAMRLARTEYARLTEQLRELTDDDWRAPTACPGWDVHAMACHALGMAEMAASPLEARRQMGAATAAGGVFIDQLTALQVDKHRHRAPSEVVARLASAGPKAARGRRLTPGFLRRRPMPEEQPVDETGTVTEPWTMGYLVDVILTRDPWMHRSDIAAATGRPMTLTADHDGVLVADVAVEWSQRHGSPCRLALTGPAGGTWEFGQGGPPLQLDAVEFCRILSGRGKGEGLLATRVPF